MPAPKVAVLNGCSAGIGFGVARHLLQTTGLSLACLSRNPSETLARLREGLPADAHDRVRTFEVDALSDEVDDQMRAASKATEAAWGKGSVRLVLCSNGILHPEKSVTQITSQTALSSFRVNTLAHLLTYAHFTPLIPSAATLARNGPPPPTGLLADDSLSLCMSLTARVASIGDNRLGGWTSYRATKAGTNAAVKTLELELAQRKSSAIALAYHPGTVKTALSAPFVARDKPEGDAHGLFAVDDAVRKWAAVVKGLRREDGGGFRDWRGDSIQW